MKVVLFVIGMLIAFAGPDAWLYFSIQQGTYTTPWYSTNWIKQPFTNAMLFWRPSTEYWKPNGTETEMWHVREVKIGNLTYWTTLERVPITK